MTAENLVHNEAIMRAIARAQEMRMFPPAASRIQAVANNPDSTLLDLEEAVATDPTLSAQLLKLANSAFFGLNRQVASLQQALFVLGFDATRNMTMALTVLSGGKTGGAEQHALWRHSIRTGIIARHLSVLIEESIPSEALMMGMLHDLGKFLMLVLDAPQYRPLLANFLLGSSMLEGERSLFSFDHAQLGAACLQHWQLPDSLCLAIHYHHALADVPAENQYTTRDATLIHLASNLEHILAAGEPAANSVPQLLVQPEYQLLALDEEAVIETILTLDDEEQSFMV